MIDTSIYQLGQRQQPSAWSAFQDAYESSQRNRVSQESARVLQQQRIAEAEQIRLKSEAARRDAEETARLQTVFSQPNPTREQIVAAAGNERGVKIADMIDAARDKDLTRFKSAHEIVLTSFAGVAALPKDMQQHAHTALRDDFIARQWAKPEEIPETFDPAFSASAQQMLLTPDKRYDVEHPKPIEVTAGATLHVPQPGEVNYTAPAKEEHSPAYKEWQDAVATGYKGSFTQYQNEDANRRANATAGGSGRPYFTYQTTYDAQGRPTGAIRFDARGGPPQFVDVSQMTGGGQLKPPPGDTGKATIVNQAVTDQLDRLIGLFDSGAKTMVGPFEGRARAFGQGVPGVPVNTDFANFEAASSAFRNGVIKAITGAQMSEPEAKRIREQIPEVSDKPEVWTAKAKQTRQNLQDLERRVRQKSPMPDDAAKRAADLIKKYGGG